MLTENIQFAIVVSEFNHDITEALLKGALERFKELGYELNRVNISRVPGAIEIPLFAQQYARTGYYDAIICLGAVIRGETDHYDYVCQQVSYGCQKVALTHHIPVIFGILTTENEKQAWQRCGGNHGHKGRESVDAAIAVVRELRRIQAVL